MKTLVLCAALCAVAAPAAAASHAWDPQYQHAVVSFADLDLSRPAGAEAGIARIRRAAQTVCGEPALPIELEKARRRAACIHRAMDEAVAQIDAPLITARYLNFTPAMRLAAR